MLRKSAQMHGEGFTLIAEKVRGIASDRIGDEYPGRHSIRTDFDCCRIETRIVLRMQRDSLDGRIESNARFHVFANGE